MLRTGDQLHHFTVTTLDGQRVNYATIWQRKILVLVSLPAMESTLPEFIDQLRAGIQDDAECVITRDCVPGVPCPGAVVADRWGEIVYLASGSQLDALPAVQDLVDWVDHVRNRCPECEGEAK